MYIAKISIDAYIVLLKKIRKEVIYYYLDLLIYVYYHLSFSLLTNKSKITNFIFFTIFLFETMVLLSKTVILAQ